MSGLKKHNKRLQDENQSLKIEMQEFEHKLSYLEYALGVIDGDGISSSDTSNFISPQNSDLRVEQTATASPTAIATTAAIATATAAATAIATTTINKDKDKDKDRIINDTAESSDIQKPSDEKYKLDKHERRDGHVTKDSTALHDQHAEEIKRLLTKNDNMLTAIKALAKAALAQKHKHDVYKNKSNVAKKEVSSVNEQLKKALLEKHEAHSLFLQEKDKKDGVQDEINRLAAIL